MATVKNTSDDYTITVADGLGTLTINADLDVVGNITYIDSTELRVTDPFITVAYDNNGVFQSMGLVAQKSSTTYAGLRFNTVSGDWEISPAVDGDGGASARWIRASRDIRDPLRSTREAFAGRQFLGGTQRRTQSCY